MDRRGFLTGAGFAGLALLCAGPVFAATGMPRTDHAAALRASKVRMRALGARYKAGGRTDKALFSRMAAEGRVFASHHRALFGRRLPTRPYLS